MSIAGLASTALYSILNTPRSSSHNSGQNNFHQIQNEFQQLGRDLQMDNLNQAKQDFVALQQDLPDLGPLASSTNPIVQTFTSLSQDLQSGNLNAAQQDYSALQQDLQQNAKTTQIDRGRHPHDGGGEENQINQTFSSLAQAVQSNTVSRAQSTFAKLQQELENLSSTRTLASNMPSFSSQSVGSTLSVTA